MQRMQHAAANSGHICAQLPCPAALFGWAQGSFRGVIHAAPLRMVRDCIERSFKPRALGNIEANPRSPPHWSQLTNPNSRLSLSLSSKCNPGEWTSSVRRRKYKVGAVVTCARYCLECPRSPAF
jgi:hypothetical protein